MEEDGLGFGRGRKRGGRERIGGRSRCGGAEWGSRWSGVVWPLRLLALVMLPTPIPAVEPPTSVPFSIATGRFTFFLSRFRRLAD